MLIAKVDPGDWLHFIERKDNKGLTLVELKEKYRDEKILFENYITNFEQHKLMIAQQAAGGSAEEKARAEVIAGYGNKFVIQLNIPTAGFETIVGIEQDGGDATYTINWGDGTIESGTGAPTRTWPAAGIYDVEIESGGFNTFSQAYTGINNGIRATLVDVLHWGNTQWINMDSMFSACVNLTGFTASDLPDTSLVTSMNNTFAFADIFDYDISNWDMSNVLDFTRTFFRATAFNKPLDSWDVSSATTMADMFRDANTFNQPLNSWDVSSVISMQNMFSSADSFDQNIGAWRMDSIFRTNGMFNGTPFNNGGSDSIKDWNVSTCQVMQGMFSFTTAFNQPLTNWDVGEVRNMREMFRVSVFDQPLNTWDTSKVTSLFGMFTGAVFNQDLDQWNTQNVTVTRNMFKDNRVFNGDISTWNMVKVTSMDSMFYGAWDFNQDISGWDIPLVIDIDFMFFDALVFNQPIGNWTTPKINSCKATFYGAAVFNNPLNTWDMNGVTRTQDMFRNATLFNQDLSGWDTSTVTNMNDMFRDATSFSQDIGAWNVGALTTATQMFITSGMTTTNYNSLLQGWVNSPRLAGTTFSNDLTYTIASNTARTSIVNTPWSVSDGGQV